MKKKDKKVLADLAKEIRPLIRRMYQEVARLEEELKERYWPRDPWETAKGSDAADEIDGLEFMVSELDEALSSLEEITQVSAK